MTFDAYVIAGIFTDNKGELFAALVGAFAGALGAFALEAYSKHLEGERKERSSIVHAQMVLLCFYNTIINLRDRELQPLREDPERHAKLRKVLVTQPELRLPLSEIMFLAEHGEPNLVMSAQVAERRYTNVMDALQVRNDCYDKVVRGNLKAFDPATRQSVLETDVRDWQGLVDSTNSLYETVDAGVTMISEVVTKLGKFGKKKYPGNTFLFIGAKGTDQMGSKPMPVV